MPEPEKIPDWTVRSLQSLAFWIGWSHARYSRWPLSEGAMVAEMQAAVATFLPSDLVALAEVPTTEVVRNASDVITRGGRIDLLIVKRDEDGRCPGKRQLAEHANVVVEVKRSQASWAEIAKDIDRLAEIAAKLPAGGRCFLVVCSEGGQKRCAKIFSSENTARNGKFQTSQAVYRTRRVLSASPSAKESRDAHLVALVEVTPNSPR